MSGWNFDKRTRTFSHVSMLLVEVLNALDAVAAVFVDVQTSRGIWHVQLQFCFLRQWIFNHLGGRRYRHAN